MPIVWSSQVTHTAVLATGQTVRSATYTQASGSLILAIGTVFDAPGGTVADPLHATSKYELGSYADERTARVACEAFCRGKSPAEISELVRESIIALTVPAGSEPKGPS